MSPTDFTQLSNAVPNMNQYLSAVPAQTAVPSATGNTTLANIGSLAGVGSLAGSFQNLGLNADMAGKFLPIVLQYVQTQGGASTMGLLQSALLP
jgi:hypothetical protein